MELIVEVRRHAESRLETARRKKLPTYEDLNPNTKFVENKAIALLASSQTVNDYLVAQTQLGALSRTHQIALYPAAGVRTTIVVTCKIRRGPSRRTSSSSRSFYRNGGGIARTGSRFGRAVDPVGDDLGFALTMVVRTLSNLRASSTDVKKVLPKFKSDDDLAFVKTLVREGFGELRPDAALYRTLHEQLGHRAHRLHGLSDSGDGRRRTDFVVPKFR